MLNAAPLWLAGGTLLGVSALREAVIRELGKFVPGLLPAPLPADPALGAVHLACDLVAARLHLPNVDGGL